MRMLVILSAVLMLHSFILIPQSRAATIQLLRTGQTTCYNSFNNVIPCAGSGQDGEIQAGVAWPNPRFVVNGDQTVTDALSGLSWTQDASLVSASWQVGLDYIRDLNTSNYLGHNDWRLPNINELTSLVNIGQSNPAAWLNLQGFSNVIPLYYWSSSSSVDSATGNVWSVDMSDGYVSSRVRANGQYVWPVRGGLPGAVILPRTGQSACYDASGNQIDCVGTGQDGELQTGAVWPIPRFVDNGDQTVTDSLSGLVWPMDANAQGPVTCSPAAGTKTWSNALGFVACLNANAYLGKSDWRLPNINELGSLIHKGQEETAAWLNGQGFSNIQAGGTYWSSSSYTATALYAWFVYLDGEGYTGFTNKTVPKYVWPVRGGQVGTPAISVSPASKDFGAVVVNATSYPQIFTISNSGTSALTVSGISLAGSDNGMFALAVGDGSGGTCGTTTTLAPAGNCTVSATFTPASIGPKNTTLRITSDDPANPVKDVTLNGTGVLPAYIISTSVIGGNGSIACDSPVTQGGTSVCTISPAAGYHLATFTDNTLDMLSAVSSNMYTISNVSAEHSVVGYFASGISDNVRIGTLITTGPTPYESLSSAFANAQNGEVLKARGITFTEPLTIAGHTVTLQGGYDDVFGARSGYSTLNGKLTVVSGKFVADRLKVR